MSATSLSAERVRSERFQPLVELLERLALPAILVVAALNYFWQLGSSDYFIDEAYSIEHSLPAFHTLIHQVNVGEQTPYTYFLFLHEWLLRTGSQAPSVTRLPSAVAGVALVGAVYWMARAFVARSVALGAAALAAISPLIQSYAQETRVYVFLMLAVVISVGTTVRACQRTDRRGLMLAIGALSAFLAIWLHYTAISVVLPLAVWVATRSQLSRRARIVFVAVCIAGVATVTPLALEQYSVLPNGGAIAGAINWSNVVSVAGTPFGTRIGTPVNARTVAGALIVVFAVVALVLSRRRPVAARGLLVALGIVGVLGLFGLDLAGKHILITRYTAVTAPFLVTVIAAACAELPRPGAVALAVGAVAVSAAGLIHNHSRGGFYPPARAAIEYIAPRERPGDFMLSPGIPLTDAPLGYYDIRLLRPKIQFFGLTDPRVPVAFALHRRIWLVDNPHGSTRAAALAAVEPMLRRYHFRALSVRTFTTSLTLGVVLTQGPR